MEQSSSTAVQVKEFFAFLSLCHKVVCEKQDNGEVKYQSPSPDEEALVKAAASNGIVLTDVTKDTYTVDCMGDTSTYTILKEFPFNSTRKRQSVILKNEAGELWLMTKGADNIMKPLINWENDQDDLVSQHLMTFACAGLRTLVMGKRQITQDDVDAILEGVDKIEEVGGPTKDDALMDFYDTYENNLNFVGASAIEDKLQDFVPETISKLIEAEIRVWVLTGDKQETAIEIGKSCKLIEEEFKQIIINVDPKIGKERSADKVYEIIKESMEEAVSTDNFNIPEKINKINMEEINLKIRLGRKRVIIIDGATLGIILDNERLEPVFFKLGLIASSVICCRVSPAQKAQVVKLSRTYGSTWISLAIGDGANDVPMIMEANIGVGIRG